MLMPVANTDANTATTVAKRCLSIHVPLIPRGD
jgi:hypothetical protein